MSYFPSFHIPLCKLSSTCPRWSNLLKMSHRMLGNLLESILIYSWTSLAHICFFCFVAYFTEIYGKRESKTRCSWLVFFPHHPPLFTPNKSLYDFSFHHLLAFLIYFSNSWAPRHIWKLLYAPMGDLTRFSKPAFDYFEWNPYALEYLM